MLHSISFWEHTSISTRYDHVIVGAGLVGLSCAIHLKQKNPSKKVLLLERGVISYGASTRNAGFSCFGTVGELEDDKAYINRDELLNTVEMRYKGLGRLQSMISPKSMDYHTTGGFELFRTKEEFEKAADFIGTWNADLKGIVGNDVFEIVEAPQSGFYEKSIFNRFEGQVNPKKAVDQLVLQAREMGVDVYFGMEVLDWQDIDGFFEINLKEGLKFHGKQLLLATNAFTSRLIEDLDVSPARNQVLITNEIDDLRWKGCFHLERGYVYFRNVGNRLLLGGGRHISTNEGTDEHGNTEEIKDYLTDLLRNELRIDHSIEISHWWSGILGIGEQKSPIIRKYAEGIFVAVRLGGMGVAIGTKVGEELANLASLEQ